MPDTPAPPWYADGLRFTCTACGDCCSGEPGYVWVNKAEIEALAARYGASVADFERDNVLRVGVRKSLREREGGDCVLLDATTRKCTAYEDRPRQCRTWPFWDSNLKNPAAWEAACKECPGSGEGRLYTLGEIDAQRRVIAI